MNKEVKNKLIGLGIFFVVFGADFGLKRLMIGVNFQIIGDFFKLIYAENTGIAFSLPIPIWLSSVFSIGLLGAGSYLAGRYLNWHKWITPVVFGLIAGGALGNLFDRVFYGFVVDYISVWWWPVFNFADATIFVGAVMIIVFYDKIVLVKHKK